MYRIHHLEQSRSHRIVWLAEELETEYELVTYQRDPQTMRAPAELKALHPLGKAPLLEDNGKIISESAIIMQYMLERSDKLLRPARGTKCYESYQYWMAFAESSAMPLLFAHLLLERASQPPAPALTRIVAQKVLHGMDKAYFDNELTLLKDYIADHLSQQPYFAGEDFSAADIQMALPVAKLAPGCEPMEQWLERVRTRPAQLRAEHKGAGIVLPQSHTAATDKTE